MSDKVRRLSIILFLMMILAPVLYAAQARVSFSLQCSDVLEREIRDCTTDRLGDLFELTYMSEDTIRVEGVQIEDSGRAFHTRINIRFKDSDIPIETAADSIREYRKLLEGQLEYDVLSLIDNGEDHISYIRDGYAVAETDERLPYFGKLDIYDSSGRRTGVAESFRRIEDGYILLPIYRNDMHAGNIVRKGPLGQLSMDTGILIDRTMISSVSRVGYSSGFPISVGCDAFFVIGPDFCSILGGATLSASVPFSSFTSFSNMRATGEISLAVGYGGKLNIMTSWKVGLEYQITGRFSMGLEYGNMLLCDGDFNMMTGGHLVSLGCGVLL